MNLARNISEKGLWSDSEKKIPKGSKRCFKARRSEYETGRLLRHSLGGNTGAVLLFHAEVVEPVQGLITRPIVEEQDRYVGWRCPSPKFPDGIVGRIVPVVCELPMKFLS